VGKDWKRGSITINSVKWSCQISSFLSGATTFNKMTLSKITFSFMVCYTSLKWCCCSLHAVLLYAIILIVILLKGILLNDILMDGIPLIFNLVNVFKMIVVLTGCHDQWHSAGCLSTDHHFAKCHSDECNSFVSFWLVSFTRVIFWWV
jgi:hypothetical protein